MDLQLHLPPFPLFIFTFVYCFSFFGALANFEKKKLKGGRKYDRIRQMFFFSWPFVVPLPLITVESHIELIAIDLKSSVARTK